MSLKAMKLALVLIFATTAANINAQGSTCDVNEGATNNTAKPLSYEHLLSRIALRRSAHPNQDIKTMTLHSDCPHNVDIIIPVETIQGGLNIADQLIKGEQKTKVWIEFIDGEGHVAEEIYCEPEGPDETVQKCTEAITLE